MRSGERELSATTQDAPRSCALRYSRHARETAGSLNAPERLRFDFSHFAHVERKELRDIEQQVNDEIRLNTQIETNVTVARRRLASGALAFSGTSIRSTTSASSPSRPTLATRLLLERALRRHARATHRRHRRPQNRQRESSLPGVRRIEAVTALGALELISTRRKSCGTGQHAHVGEDAILAQVEKLSQNASTWRRNWKPKSARMR